MFDLCYDIGSAYAELIFETEREDVMKKQGYRIRYWSNLGTRRICLYAAEANNLEEAKAYATHKHGKDLVSVRFTKASVYETMPKDGPHPSIFEYSDKDDIKALIKRVDQKQKFEDQDDVAMCDAVEKANKELGDKVSNRALFNLYAYRWNDLVAWAA